MENSGLPNILIEKIRNRDVILWVGSGFSIVAGYPSAKQLGDIIKQNVESEKLKFFENKELDGIAEEYTQIYSREKLERILIDSFSAEPTNIEYHKMIAKIPQIETIITTNYDKLFEKAYAEDLVKIVSDIDIAKSANDKLVNLYKIHGCIDSPDKIIITKSDYRKFFTTGQFDLLWNALKVLATQHSILFIGYSFEDQNIKYIFEEILKHLGDNHKDYFLISPNIPEHKQQVLNQYSIKYIPMKAEDAIPEIFKIIDEHIIEDGLNGRIPPVKWQKALDDRKIVITPKINDGKIEIDTIKTKDSSVKVGGEFNFKVTEKNKEKIQELYDMIEGKKIGEIKLTKEDDEVDLKMLYGNSIFIGGEAYNVQELSITPALKEITAKIILKESGLGFDNVKGEQCGTGILGQIKFHPPGFDIVMNLKKSDSDSLNIDINYKFHIESAFQGYQLYNFFNDWLDSDEIQIYTNLAEQPFLIPFIGSNTPDDSIKHIRILHMIYTAINEIERGLKIGFKKYTDFTAEEIEDIRVVINLLREKQSDLSSWIIRMNKEAFIDIDNVSNGQSIKINYSSVDYVLLDKLLKLNNCSVTIVNAYIEDKEKILTKFNEGNDLVLVTIQSKVNQILLSVEDIMVLQ